MRMLHEYVLCLAALFKLLLYNEVLLGEMNFTVICISNMFPLNMIHIYRKNIIAVLQYNYV